MMRIIPDEECTWEQLLDLRKSSSKLLQLRYHQVTKYERLSRILQKWLDGEMKTDDLSEKIKPLLYVYEG